MDSKWKIISGVTLTIFGLLGAGFTLEKHFVPREVYDMQLAGVASQILQMQKNNEMQYWINQKTIWENEVKKFQELSIRRPNDARLRYQLDDAKRKRDNAERNIQRLQAQ